jgi:mannose/fructose/N-acetylgalactosamine-specific phosphotransferase system component IIC
MIPLAVPIAFAVLALVAWRYDARARRAYEATLSAAEKRQFRALRRVHPLRWRAIIVLKQAEAAVTAQDVESREPKKVSQRRAG